ncbi:hypothetical protein AAHC03_05189 [Spirometra sp. Aus1]|nr:unnamed protein product [Spirometra erinaceieuropaei]
MRGSRKNTLPGGTLISLSGKSRRPLTDVSRGNPPIKKPRPDVQEVNPAELVSRVEALVSSGNTTEADSVLLSVFSHLRSSQSVQTLGLGSSRPSGFGASASSSRLPAALSLGLLVLGRSQPSLFSRPAIQDQLTELITHAPRGFNATLPPAVVATIAARSRGLYVLASNLLMVALTNQQKWPSKLVKAYLEDSLGDRIWVDLDECKAFVLNIETAFPTVLGDPKGLFTVLCSSAATGGGASGTPGSGGNSSGSGFSTQPVQAALYLTTPSHQGQRPSDSGLTARSMLNDLTDAITTVLGSHSANTAKVVHGGEPGRLVSPRFESSRAAVEVIIVHTLREALARRTGSGGTTVVSTSSGASDSSSNTSLGVLSSGEVIHTRCLIRTLGLAAGIPELRSLTSLRLEPWLTNPKLQILGAGLFAIIATNCRLGALSPYDIDVMVTIIYRIRLKLLKSNIQSSVLESVCRLALANSSNLATMITLCLAGELPTTTSAVAESGIKQQTMASALPPTQVNASTSPSARSIGETIRVLCSSSGVDSRPSELLAATVASVAAGAAEAVGHGHSSSVALILPKLYQRFPSQVAKVLGEILHDRIVDAVTADNSLSLAHPSDSEMVANCVTLMAPMRRFLRDLTKWVRMAAAAGFNSVLGSDSQNTQSLTSGGTAITSGFLPCAELGYHLLHLDRTAGFSTFPEAAANITQRLLTASKKAGQEGFSPFLVLRYICAVVHILCQLQLLSATRLNWYEAPTSKKKSSGTETMKQHLACVRQLRLNFLRWFKSFLPHLISTCAPHFPPTSPRDAFTGLVHLLRRALFLEATAPLDQAAAVSSSECEMGSGCHFSDFYAADELLPSSQDQTHFVSLLTYVNLPEKLAHQVLLCGLESHRGLLSAADAAEVVCELIWRATALSMDSSFEPANFNKPEQLIDLLYACCAYCPGQGVPSELSELAHSGTYWKVSLALVALAANLPKTCGAHLWLHYPTVRRLMEMVITNNFFYPPLTLGQNSDTNAVESERLNREMEAQLILQLESRILASKMDDGVSEGDKSVAVPATSEQSTLIGQLVRNNPRGACRCPPQKQLATLRNLCETLSLRRRLCSSRQPDFLLELIRSQGQGLPQPWLLELVESVGCSMEALPLQCLSEYLLYDTATRIHCADEQAFASFDLAPSPPPSQPLCRPRQRSSSQGPSSQPMEACSDVAAEKLDEKVLRPRRNRLESTSSGLSALEKSSDHPVRSISSAERWRLQCRIVDRLRVQARCPPVNPMSRTSDPIAGTVTDAISVGGSTGGVTPTAGFTSSLGPSDDNIAEAVLQSFAYRLKDASSVVRRAAWHCLALLAVEDSSAIQLGQEPVHPNRNSGSCLDSVEGRLVILQELLGLVGLSVPTDNSTLTTSTEIDPCAVSTVSRRVVEFRCLILDSLLAAILVEEELLPLTTYILFVGQLTEYPDFTAWRPVMTCFGQLLLTRRSLVHDLFTSSRPLDIEPYSSLAREADAAAATTNVSTRGVSSQTFQALHSSGFIILEVIASIFVRDIDYYCTSAEAIPVDEKNSVFVAWSAGRECPMELETLESHLVLLSCVPRSLAVLAHSWPSPTAWWIRLLDTWFHRLEGDKPRYAFPHMASLAAKEETMRTPRGLLTFNPATQSACPLTLAPELRSAFLLTDQPQMVCVALDGLESVELVDLVRSTPPLLLSPSTAVQLLELLSELPEPALAGTAGIMRLLGLRAQKRASVDGVDLATSHVFGTPTSTAVSTGTPAAPSSAKPPFSTGRPRTADGKNLWRDLVFRLSAEAGGPALKIFSSVLTNQLHSAACRSKWILDLFNELNSAAGTPSNRRSLGCPSSTALVDLILDLPEPQLCRMLLLISIAITRTSGGDEKLLSRQQSTRELCISRFERALEMRQSSPVDRLVRQILLKPLRRASRPFPVIVEDSTASCSFSLSCPDEVSLRLPLSQLIDPVFGSLEQRLQLLTLFGFSAALPPDMRTVSMLKMASPGESASQSDLDNFWSLVRSLVFSEAEGKTAFDPPVRRFLLEELVHNAGSSILRLCLRRILHEDVSLLSSSRVLDFVTTLLNLPTFAPPVPLAEPHERPDVGTFYSALHRFTDPVEALHLLLHILSESIASSKSQERDEKILSAVESKLSTRSALFDLALQSWPRISVICLEILCGFADASPANLPSNLFRILMSFVRSNSSALRQHAQNFLICVYLRRPGLKYLLTSSKAHILLSQPSAACLTIPICFEQSEIDRLGPSFLIGLSSSQETVRDMSAIASCTLAVNHPRACLRLLPLAAGLSQGRLESASTGGLTSISWTKFVSRYHLDFFLGLLHFMELLAFQTCFDVFTATEEHIRTSKPMGILFSAEAETYRYSIDRILLGLIHVMASYPNHARKMSGLSVRLARLLQAYAACATWAFATGALMGPPIACTDGNSAVPGESISSTDLLRTRGEMLRLANQFNEFASFSGLLSPITAAVPSASGYVTSPPSRALLLPFAPPKPAKQCNPSNLRPFIQRLSFSSDSDDIVGILMDLDRVSERKFEVLQHFQGELERLVTQDASSLGSLSEKADEAKTRPPTVLALKLLFRLLRMEPQRASTCLETVYLPCLLFGAGREAEMAFLPEACLLAPQLAPRLLLTAAVASLLVTQGCTASACIRAVSEALLRLTLDGLDVACIEHAASGLLSTPSGPKFTPT